MKEQIERSAYVGTCDCNPEFDPWHRDTQGYTYTVFYIDLESGEYGIRQECNDNNRAIREWLGLVQVEIINRPDEGSAHDWLHSSAIMRVVSELLECSFVKWDGANHVGALGTVGDMLFCDLVEGVNELPDNDWSVWGADEWLDMSTDLELGLMPGMTEVQIDSLAESHVTGALADHVLLYGTVEFLQSRVRGMDGYND